MFFPWHKIVRGLSSQFDWQNYCNAFGKEISFTFWVRLFILKISYSWFHKTVFMNVANVAKVDINRQGRGNVF